MKFSEAIKSSVVTYVGVKVSFPFFISLNQDAIFTLPYRMVPLNYLFLDRAQSLAKDYRLKDRKKVDKVRGDIGAIRFKSFRRILRLQKRICSSF
jgi:hypothetical protein